MSTKTLTENLQHVKLSGYKEQLNSEQTVGHDPTYKYNHLAPHSDTSLKFPPLEPFEHEDRGKRVPDPLNNPLEHLLGNATTNDITPILGTEVTGDIQLSKLDEKAKDELAALVARRRLVVFRKQDFADQSNDFFIKWGESFGRNHVHPTSGHPEGIPEIHLVYRDAKSSFNQENQNKLSTVAIHSDVTYELQPPGTTTFFILDIPEGGGGDTVFVSQVEAYNRLSDEFKKRLEGLEAEHSGFEQAEYSRQGNRGGVVRREPVKHIHPLVRTHPVTGERALFVNPQFTRRIVGFKNEESDYLLNFLYDHIAKGIDFHARVKYEPGTVVLWDNRITAHTALLDYKSGERRHAARITPQAERPFYK